MNWVEQFERCGAVGLSAFGGSFFREGRWVVLSLCQDLRDCAPKCFLDGKQAMLGFEYSRALIKSASSPTLPFLSVSEGTPCISFLFLFFLPLFGVVFLRDELIRWFAGGIA